MRNNRHILFARLARSLSSLYDQKPCKQFIDCVHTHTHTIPPYIMMCVFIIYMNLMQRVRHIIRRFNFNEQIIWFIWRLKWNHLTISVIMFYNYTAIVIITLAQRFSCKRSSAFALRAKKIIVLRLCAEKRTHPIYLYVCRIGREREREGQSPQAPLWPYVLVFGIGFGSINLIYTQIVYYSIYTYVCCVFVQPSLFHYI